MDKDGRLFTRSSAQYVKLPEKKTEVLYDIVLVATSGVRRSQGVFDRAGAEAHLKELAGELEKNFIKMPFPTNTKEDGLEVFISTTNISRVVALPKETTKYIFPDGAFEMEINEADYNRLHNLEPGETVIVRSAK